ncbi:Flagellar assembly factor FliW [Thermobacillus xylanilyticus]|uniref:Flagellar assembly factor FliW n=1 Tax=Thermobacillus xylanilyticus TaxID=76633 RepID=A0ABN7S158_THEXY|nr:flagellar assembly protein FliW [Thermobacillus xylanilyticus]CAG5088518.1 Flagellar assembly factor FliW [Thermobacillus xylanilyticus]
MKMETTRFGEIEINEQEIITFPDGIPGFERDRRFVILELEDLDGFACLQCIDRGELSFIIVNPFVFFPEYEFNLPDAEAQQLEIAEPGDVAVWSIVTIRDELESATVNLVAPIVLNRQKRLGKQVILVDPNLSTRHALFRTAKEV